MENKLIKLATYTISRAKFFQARLETEGISCFLEHQNSIDGSTSGAVAVIVREVDADRALEIAMEIEEEYGQAKIAEEELVEDIKKLVVPIDFSDYSLNACIYALAIAQELKAEIVLLHAYYFPVISSFDYVNTATFTAPVDKTLGDIQDDAMDNMKNFKEKIVKLNKKTYDTDIEISIALANGNPVDEILNYAKFNNADVIIMGSHGKSDSGDHLGQISEIVMAESSIPVLIIPKKAVFDGISHINILYATAFDESDYLAIKKLMTLVYAFDITIYCAHLITDPRFDKIKMQNLKKHFDKRYSGYEVHCALLQDDNLPHAIQKFVQENGIDIITFTTHKRGLLTGILYPSQAKEFLYQSDKPILVFHAK